MLSRFLPGEAKGYRNNCKERYLMTITSSAIYFDVFNDAQASTQFNSSCSLEFNLIFPVYGLFIFNQHCEIAPFIFVYLGLVRPSAVTA